MVFGCRHVGRIVLKTAAPGIAGVDINRVTVSLKFPYARYLEVVPAFVIEAGFPEVRGAGVGISYPEEFPGAVQAHKVFGVFLDCLGSHFSIFIRKEVCVHGCPVDGIDLRVLPFFKRLCAGREHTST